MKALLALLLCFTAFALIGTELWFIEKSLLLSQ
jgi:hypothetical protein